MSPFLLFVVFLLVVWGSAIYLARNVIRGLSAHAAENVKLYAPAFAKGGALVAIATLSSFVEIFEKLSSDVAAVLPWWSWLTMFCVPVIAALTTLVAFMDRSLERVREQKKARGIP
jgi:hypothetical protein